MVGRYHSLYFIFIFGALAALSGCTAPSAKTSPAPATSMCSSTVSGSEASYCSTVNTFGSFVTVTGTATFQRRVSGASGLGAATSNDLPVRFAEIRVLDGNGNVIQCGETDNAGAFSVSVPTGSSSITLQVNSRADNAHMKASVLDRQESNRFYSINTSFVPGLTSGATNNRGTITASATDSLVTGGAFNIYEQILRANEYLVASTSNNATSGSSQYSPAYKISAFWTAGFNPGCYFGSSAGISYYSTGTSKLYILGGLSGDVNNTDTDHFDNSVILHEYGHFIEDMYAKSDSPGGSHNGEYIIDPRLAWGEGWANFFSMAVIKYAYGAPLNDTKEHPGMYIDTYGNSSGSTYGNYFYYDASANSPKRDPSQVGYTQTSTEGNFREFAITRSLYRGIATYSAPFNDYWRVFTGSNGIKNTSYRFRNFGLFMNLYNALTLPSPTSLAVQLSAESQVASSDDYGTYSNSYISKSTNYTRTITAKSMNGKSEDGSFAMSNQDASNDFYAIYHAGGSMTVSVTRNSGAGDLDIYVYREGYTFGVQSNMAGYSNASGPNDSVTIPSLAAGYYMVQVMVYTGGGLPGATNYTVRVD